MSKRIRQPPPGSSRKKAARVWTELFNSRASVDARHALTETSTRRRFHRQERTARSEPYCLACLPACLPTYCSPGSHPRAREAVGNSAGPKGSTLEREGENNGGWIRGLVCGDTGVSRGGNGERFWGDEAGERCRQRRGDGEDPARVCRAKREDEHDRGDDGRRAHRRGEMKEAATTSVYFTFIRVLTH